jgi:branched-chain amino acid transport system permease protein
VSAGIYTLLLEVLRPFGAFRMMLMSALLVLLMLFRPRGIMGFREFSWLLPASERKSRVPAGSSPPPPAGLVEPS